MIFRARRGRDPREGRPAAARHAATSRSSSAATHNHHGPDTAFDVNHDWYEHMTDQAADAVVAAVERLRPGHACGSARARTGSAMDDGTDPQVIDPSMNVLQAVGPDGRA